MPESTVNIDQLRAIIASIMAEPAQEAKMALIGKATSVVTLAPTADRVPAIVLTANQTGALVQDAGAGFITKVTLPTAAAGLEFTFLRQSAHVMEVYAAAGDDITVLGVASAVAGFQQANTAGDALTLVAVDATHWVAIGGADLAGWSKDGNP